MSSLGGTEPTVETLTCLILRIADHRHPSQPQPAKWHTFLFVTIATTSSTKLYTQPIHKHGRLRCHPIHIHRPGWLSFCLTGRDRYCQTEKRRAMASGLCKARLPRNVHQSHRTRKLMHKLSIADWVRSLLLDQPRRFMTAGVWQKYVDMLLTYRLPPRALTIQVLRPYCFITEISSQQSKIFYN
jgi:hypothetical protein